MWEKIINKLKKDLIIISLYGIIVFFIGFDIYKSFIIALLWGLIAAAKLKVIIFFIRSIIKSTAADLSASKSDKKNYSEPANEVEKNIVDSIIKLIKLDETKKSILVV